MRCPSCGSQNDPGRRYCLNCGMSLVRDHVQMSAPRKSSLGKIVIIVIVLVVVALIAVPALMYLFVASSFGPGTSFSDDLELLYDNGNTTGYPMVTVSGSISNLGEEPFYATIQATISDSRGWSKDSTISVGTVPAGGQITIDQGIAWPLEYNGISLWSESGRSVAPTWTYHIMTQGVEQ